MILILLIMSIKRINHIKNWEEITPREKNWDIIIWTTLVLFLIVFLAKIIRGD